VQHSITVSEPTISANFTPPVARFSRVLFRSAGESSRYPARAPTSISLREVRSTAAGRSFRTSGSASTARRFDDTRSDEACATDGDTQCYKTPAGGSYRFSSRITIGRCSSFTRFRSEYCATARLALRVRSQELRATGAHERRTTTALFRLPLHSHVVDRASSDSVSNVSSVALPW